MAYKPLTAVDANALERETLEQWEQEKLFQQTMRATADGDPFVFYEGPPTANGKPGIHHVFARTIKDLICRYRSMTGRSVTRIAGWDTHGLPVEISVEKELGISGKSDIEAFGIAEFNRRCRESVLRYKNDWEQLSNRIGYWLDYDRPYVTYTNEYIESVWWLLAELWKKGLLYEGRKVLPYCPRCGTSLSSHELALGYAEHRSPSIYAKFSVVSPNDDGESRALLVWTTTPWTLPSNVAIAVNPEFEYVEIDVDGTGLIVERTIAESKVVPGALEGEPLASRPVRRVWSGSELIGWQYEQLLDVVDIPKDEAFRVVGGDFVTRHEGTGLVHMAPAFGADDYDTIRREGMAFVNPVDEAGRFVDTSWDEINGKTVFEANAPIAARLESAGKLFGRYEAKGYEHTYPFCWRCDAPLIYYARRSWFVRTTAFRHRMVEFNNQVRWQPPEVGEGRFGEWLENNVDWALSRDRYWGTPLPVWVCEQDEQHKTVIGSYDALAARSGQALGEDFDPHKPFIDDTLLDCDQCTGKMRRVPEVIDAWFDSGAMPFAQWHYPFENKEEFTTHFPADYICEALDQTRGWFYSLVAIAAGVVDQPAYRNVIVNGLVLDADGQKMSKRIGNVVDPWDAIGEFGADAVRLYLVGSGQVWLAKKFDRNAIPEVSIGFLNQLKNVYNFFANYALDWVPTDGVQPSSQFIDRWLVSRLDELVEDVHAAWSNYDVRTGVRKLIEFCDIDLSNWYVRLNRARFWAPDSVADPDALSTLHETLVTFVRLLAPAAPFMSDAIHRRLTGQSVHLASFPQSTGSVNQTLNDSMDVARKLVGLARTARESASIRGRQPLETMQVAVPAAARGPELAACLELLKREVNVKSIDIVESDADLVSLSAKANFRSLGKVYGKETPNAAAASKHLTAAQLSTLEEGEGVTLDLNGTRFAYRPEDIVVVREVKTDWVVQSDGPFVVALNPDISTTLRLEGLAREVVNRIQKLRKEAGYTFTTRIVLGLTGSSSVLDAVQAHSDYIAGETLARQLLVGSEAPKPDLTRPVEIDGESVAVSMTRV